MQDYWNSIISWLPWGVIWLIWGVMIFIELYIFLKWELQYRTNQIEPKGSNNWSRKDPYANLNASLLGISFVVLIIGGFINILFIAFLPIMFLLTSIGLFFVYFVCRLVVKFAPESDHAKGIVEFKQKHLTRKKKIVKEVVDSK